MVECFFWSSSEGCFEDILGILVYMIIYDIFTCCIYLLNLIWKMVVGATVVDFTRMKVMSTSALSQ